MIKKYVAYVRRCLCAKSERKFYAKAFERRKHLILAGEFLAAVRNGREVQVKDFGLSRQRAIGSKQGVDVGLQPGVEGTVAIDRPGDERARIGRVHRLGQAAMIVALIYLLGIAMTPLLPETRGKPLPD